MVMFVFIGAIRILKIFILRLSRYLSAEKMVLQKMLIFGLSGELSDKFRARRFPILIPALRRGVVNINNNKNNYIIIIKHINFF